MDSDWWPETSGDTEDGGLVLSLFSPNQVDAEDPEGTADGETGTTWRTEVLASQQKAGEQLQILDPEYLRAQNVREHRSKVAGHFTDGSEGSEPQQRTEPALFLNGTESRAGASVIGWGGAGSGSAAERTSADDGEERIRFRNQPQSGPKVRAAEEGECGVFDPEGDVLVTMECPGAEQVQATDFWTQGTKSTCSGDGSVSGLDAVSGIAGDETSKVSSFSPTPEILATRSVSPQRGTVQKLVARSSVDALVKQLIPLPPGTHFDWPSKK